jgi:hypothetical protein
MNLQAFAALAAFSLLAAPVPRDATAKDKRALQGTWVHASLVADGEDVPVRLLPNRTVVIEGDKLTEKDGERLVSRSPSSWTRRRSPRPSTRRLSAVTGRTGTPPAWASMPWRTTP